MITGASMQTKGQLDRTYAIYHSLKQYRTWLFTAAFGIIPGVFLVIERESNLYTAFGLILLAVSAFAILAVFLRTGFRLMIVGNRLRYRRNFFDTVKKFTVGDIVYIRSETAHLEDNKNVQHTYINVGNYTICISSDMANYDNFVRYITQNTNIKLTYGSGKDETTNGRVVVRPKRIMVIIGCIMPVTFVVIMLPVIYLTSAVDSVFFWLMCMTPVTVVAVLVWNVNKAGYKVEITACELIIKDSAFGNPRHIPINDITAVNIEEPTIENQYVRSAKLLFADEFVLLRADLHGFENFIEFLKSIIPEKINTDV